MTKKELLEWYSSIKSEKMPQYIEIDDANNTQLSVNGEWKNVVFSWALLFDGIKWKYVETDSERGYVFDLKTFDTEFAAVEYAKNILNQKYLATKGNSKEEMLCRFIQQKFGYSEKRANAMVIQMAKHDDIFEEFFNFARVGKFCKKDKSQTKVHGYTAEFLSREYNLSPLGAYNYLVYLMEDPEQAIADLKAGLPTRDSSKIEQLINQDEAQKTMDEKKQGNKEAIGQRLPDEPLPAHLEFEHIESQMLLKLDAVQQALATLQQTFDDKIAEDTHKNGLFDNMHRELVRYQNGVLDKIVDTIALDIIQLVDTTKGHVRVYEKKEPTEENYKKLLRIVKGIAEDLEDILYRQNIESYRVPGHEVDVHCQKIIQTVPTDDKSKDNRIAVRVADGYEKGDKILRPERIKIFKYKENSDTPSEN